MPLPEQLIHQYTLIRLIENPCDAAGTMRVWTIRGISATGKYIHRQLSKYVPAQPKKIPTSSKKTSPKGNGFTNPNHNKDLLLMYCHLSGMVIRLNIDTIHSVTDITNPRIHIQYLLK